MQFNLYLPLSAALLCALQLSCSAQTMDAEQVHRKIHPSQRTMPRCYVLPGSSWSTPPSSYIEEGSTSRSANPGAGYVQSSLPKAIHGPNVGMPGDVVSRGQTVSGSGALSGGLPRVRSSPYMDGYGDHVRTDLGYKINGTVNRKPVQTRTAPAAPTIAQPMFTYGDPLTPAYRSSR